MMVQARTSFGFRGNKLPALVRSVPAIVWFGFQSWVGAGALNLVSETMFRFESIVFWFVAFLALQIALSVLGFHGIKWVENIGTVFIIGALVCMFVSVLNRYGDAIGTNLVDAEGIWGAPFWGRPCSSWASTRR
ncbi:cytosine permease [Mangrovicoccus sp. HB161399]|uniref:cytosine permease n=1 Tax=Mangrovicoccus sp. HB161399 TaxID=2720392 RepID=UPI0020A6400A|nr:cytosine permease [Mangrovicoccus sp. HB161399]